MKIIFLLIASTATTALSAEELPRDYFNGLQLAFVRKPAIPVEEEAVVQPKPKTAPATKPAPATVIKPAQEVKPAIL